MHKHSLLFSISAVASVLVLTFAAQTAALQGDVAGSPNGVMLRSNGGQLWIGKDQHTYVFCEGEGALPIVIGDASDARVMVYRFGDEFVRYLVTGVFDYDETRYFSPIYVRESGVISTIQSIERGKWHYILSDRDLTLYCADRLIVTDDVVAADYGESGGIGDIVDTDWNEGSAEDSMENPRDDGDDVVEAPGADFSMRMCGGTNADAEGNGTVRDFRISSIYTSLDGRFSAYNQAGANGGNAAAYLFDWRTKTEKQIGSTVATMSRNGRYIIVSAENSWSGYQIYDRERDTFEETGETHTVSYVDISDDGRYVAYTSPYRQGEGSMGDPDSGHAHILDRETGVSTIIDTLVVSESGERTFGKAYGMSADGRFVAFVAYKEIRAGQNTDYFGVYDRVSGQVTRINYQPTYNSQSDFPARISADGSKVYYISWPSSGDSGQKGFTFDRLTGQITETAADSGLLASGTFGNDGAYAITKFDDDSLYLAVQLNTTTARLDVAKICQKPATRAGSCNVWEELPYPEFRQYVCPALPESCVWDTNNIDADQDGCGDDPCRILCMGYNPSLDPESEFSVARDAYREEWKLGPQ